jgi:hypothetical protein
MGPGLHPHLRPLRGLSETGARDRGPVSIGTPSILINIKIEMSDFPPRPILILLLTGIRPPTRTAGRRASTGGPLGPTTGWDDGSE